MQMELRPVSGSGAEIGAWAQVQMEPRPIWDGSQYEETAQAQLQLEIKPVSGSGVEIGACNIFLISFLSRVSNSLISDSVNEYHISAFVNILFRNIDSLNNIDQKR